VDKEIHIETPTSTIDEAIQIEDLLEFFYQTVQSKDLLEVMDNDMKIEPQTDTENVIFLLAKVNKWNYQVSLFKEDMIPFPQNEKDIKELREKWAKELAYQKHRWEKEEIELK
jgi:hypothetical protein